MLSRTKSHIEEYIKQNSRKYQLPEGKMNRELLLEAFKLSETGFNQMHNEYIFMKLFLECKDLDMMELSKLFMIFSDSWVTNRSKEDKEEYRSASKSSNRFVL